MEKTRFSTQRIALLFLLTALLNPLLASAAQLPAEHRQGEVTYLSGGIGQGEAEAIRQAAGQYPLEMLFVSKEPDGHDAYLAADKVIVRDRHGKIVLNTLAEGPYLLAKLPAGRYEIEAVDQGKAREHSVNVSPGKHVRQVFEW